MTMLPFIGEHRVFHQDVNLMLTLLLYHLGNFSIYKIRLKDGKIIEITHPNRTRPRHGRHLAAWEETVYLSWEASNPVLLTK